MTILRVVLILIIGFLLVFISIQNSQITIDRVYVFKAYENVLLSTVMLYAFGFGLLTIGIFAVIDEIRLRSRLQKQKKERDALFEELKALRNLSIGLGEEKEKK